MAENAESRLRQQLTSGVFSPVYFLYGNEPYLKLNYAERIVKKSVTKRQAGFDYLRFEGGEFTVDELADAAELLPLGVAVKCLEIVDLPLPELSANEYSKLLELLRDPPPTAIMIFRFQAVDPQKNAKGEQKSRFAEVTELIREHGLVVCLDQRDENGVTAMINSSVTRRGCRISSSTARYLVQTCGTDLTTLRNELDKLTAVRQNAEITQQDIDTYCCRTLESDTFAMVRAVNRGDAEKALRILSDLFVRKTEPLLILGAITSSYLNMYRARAAQGSSMGVDGFAKKTGVKASSLSYALKNASGTSVQTLRSCVAILQQADGSMKNGRGERANRILIEETLIRLLRETKKQK